MRWVDVVATIRRSIVRLCELVGRKAIRSEMEEEFAFHLEMEARHLVERGLSPAAARREALRRFGGVERIRHDVRKVRGVARVERVLIELRLSVRRLARRPGFTTSVIATLAVAMAATAAVFAVVWTVLLRPLPYAAADRLVRIQHDVPGLDIVAAGQSAPVYALYRRSARSFDAYGVYYTTDAVTITDGESAERVRTTMLTAEVLGMTGWRAAAGRLTASAEAGEGVVISHGLWMRRFAGDPSAVGRTIELNRRPRTIVGVVPAGAGFPSPESDLYVVLPDDRLDGGFGDFFYEGVARLRPGVTAEAAAAELAALLPRLPELDSNVSAATLASAAVRPKVTGLRASLVGEVRAPLTIIGVSVLFLLVTALANVVNLYLLRSEGVGREVAVSRAIGAGSGDLLRRFVVDAVVVAGSAATFAIPLGLVAVRATSGSGAADVPRLHELGSGRAEVVSATVALALVFAATLTATSWFSSSRAGAAGLLRATRTSSGLGWSRVRRALVTAQVSFALTLLVAGTVLARSTVNLMRLDRGFDARSVLVFDLPLPYRGYETYQQAVAFHAAVADSLRALQGIVAAEPGTGIPLRLRRADAILRVRDAAGTGEANVALAFASRGFFQALGIPVVEGTGFHAADLTEEPAILLSASAARALFGTAPAAGRFVRFVGYDDYPAYRVAGVVGDVLGAEPAEGPIATLYLPDQPAAAQGAIRSPYIPRESGAFVLRADGDPRAFAADVRRVVRALDPRVAVAGMTTLDDLARGATARERLAALLVGVASVVALLLAAIGLHGVIAYSVAARTRELGLRLALGAAPRSLARQVVVEAAAIAAVGTVAGIVLALALTRALRVLLFQVGPADPLAIGAAVAVLIAAVAVSVAWPARRAAAVDPAAALRLS
jgi:putative ABC transport system permease protein